MKLISCSQCGALVKPKLTSFVDHKRVCYMCKSELNKKQEQLFFSAIMSRGRNLSEVKGNGKV